MDSYWAAYSSRGALVWVDSDHLDAPRRRLRVFDAASGALRAQYVLASNDTGIAMPPVSDDDRRVAFVAPDHSVTLATLDGHIRHVRGSYAAAGFCRGVRSEEHTSELQSLMRISYAVFCLKKKIKPNQTK